MIFKNRKLLIATKHKKEQVIAPILQNELEVECFVTDLFDTDTLGTFTGEIERKNDAFTTLKNKCLMAIEVNNCDLVVASEGSFGAHPTIFFAQANEELIMLYDAKNQLEITAREISTDTNFNVQTITSWNELIAFSKKALFPSHAVILKSSNNSKIIKGITTEEELFFSFTELKKEFSSIVVETDMRAQFNPTRMKVIEKVAQKLLQTIKNECPICKTPGFDIVKAIQGLPCENCSLPTRSTLSYLYRCKKCEFQSEKLYPRGIEFEDPTYCDNCNP